VHQDAQCRWRIPARTGKEDAKPIADLLANGTAVHAVDLNIVNVIGHENILKMARRLVSCPIALAACSYQSNFLNQSAGLAVSQAGVGEVWPDLVPAIANDRPDLEPVSFGQCDPLARFNLRGKTRQHDHGRSQKQKNRQG
jgi:hypothetical protein